MFDAAAAEYRDGRSGYPDQLYRLLATRYGLRSGARVLEVGAGSGQATVRLLELGAHVTVVEPGAALVAELVAGAAGGELYVLVDSFERAEVGEDSFDLVVAATAFHWVKPDIGYPKAARALHDAGWLVLWWTVWGDPARPDPLHQRLEPVLARKAPALIAEGSTPGRHALDANARRAEIERTGAFGPVEHELIRWTGQHDPRQARALFGTFSSWLALPTSQRAELLDDVESIVRDDLGGTVERPYLTAVYAAQRRGRRD